MGQPGRVSAASDALFTSVSAGHRVTARRRPNRAPDHARRTRRAVDRVIAGGRLEAHKGINVPGVALRTSALTPKDIEDLHAGIAMGVDLVAMSFVQSADDVRHGASGRRGGRRAGPADRRENRKAAGRRSHRRDPRVADGLMVARGDLGIELPLESLPTVQRRLILAARRRGVPVIVATQVLESMRTSRGRRAPRSPTRRTAVDEGADAIMLAGETAIGQYPVRRWRRSTQSFGKPSGRRAVRRALVPTIRGWRPRTPDRSSWHGGARARACEAAVALADRARAAAIVAVTSAGRTARMLAALRPAARIIAATERAQDRRASGPRLGRDARHDRGRERTAHGRRLRRLGGTCAPSRPGRVVFVSMHAVLGREGTNFVHVERL